MLTKIIEARKVLATVAAKRTLSRVFPVEIYIAEGKSQVKSDESLRERRHNDAALT